MVQAVKATPMTYETAIAMYDNLLPGSGKGRGSGYTVKTPAGDFWATAKEFEEIFYESGKDAIEALKDLVKTVTTKEVQEKLDVALELYDERNSFGRRIYTIANVIELTGVPFRIFNEALKARKGV